MENNNQNKPMGWKERLDEMGQVPGAAPLDKPAAWNRLEERLKPQRDYKRLIVALAVAASLFVAFLFLYPVLFSNKPSIDSAQGSKKEIPVTNDESKKIMPEQQTQIIVAVPKTEQKKMVNPETAHPASIQKEVAEIKEQESVAKTEIQEPVITSPSVLPVDSTVTARKTPEVRKLKVVHINEINPGRGEDKWAVQQRKFVPGYTIMGEVNSSTATQNTSRIRFNPSN